MAIAFDSVTGSTDSGPTTSHSLSFTNTAGNIVFVGVRIGNTSTIISAMQYDGVAMTAHSSNPFQNAAGERIFFFFLTSPSTGANNITFTTSASVTAGIVASSYSGVSSSGQPDNEGSSSNNTGVGDIPITLTSVADNSWQLGFWRDANGVVVAGAGTTLRSTSNSVVIMDNNADITPAGSNTIRGGAAGGSNGGVLSFTFSPSVPVVFIPRVMIY